MKCFSFCWQQYICPRREGNDNCDNGNDYGGGGDDGGSDDDDDDDCDGHVCERGVDVEDDDDDDDDNVNSNDGCGDWRCDIVWSINCYDDDGTIVRHCFTFNPNVYAINRLSSVLLSLSSSSS